MENNQYGGTGTGSGETGQLVTEQVRQGAQQAVQSTQQLAGQAVEGAKQQATSVLDSRRQQAAQSLTSISKAFDATSEQLRVSGQDMPAQLVESVGSRVENFATYLQNSDTQRLIWDVEDLAQRNTPLFLGGAFALGILAARFLKSSAPKRTASYGSGYGGTQYGSQYGGYGQNAGGAYGANYGGNYGGTYGQTGYDYTGTADAAPSTYDYTNPPSRFDDIGGTPDVRVEYVEGSIGETRTSTVDANNT